VCEVAVQTYEVVQGTRVCIAWTRVVYSRVEFCVSCVYSVCINGIVCVVNYNYGQL
jgi:hypothetical protein